MKQIKAFAVTYYKGNVRDNEKLKELVIPLVDETKNDCQVPEGWLTTKAKTSFENDKIANSLSNIVELKSQYFEVIKDFFDDKFEIKVNDIWYNSYTDGEYQEAHNHLGDALSPSHFACVHFLSFDPSIHSPLTFMDPMANIRHLSINMKSENYEQQHYPNVREGDLIMFPAYLDHEVKSFPPTPDSPRITISFNVTVTRYDGLDYDD